MVQYTPNHNLPFVEPPDTVTTYPVTSQELATTLDSVIPKLWMASGPSVTTDANGKFTLQTSLATAAGAVAGAFGSGVIVSIESTSGGQITFLVINHDGTFVTNTGFYVYVIAWGS